MIVPNSFTGQYPDQFDTSRQRPRVVRVTGVPRFILINKPAKAPNQAAAQTAALAGGVRRVLGLSTPGSGQPSGMPAQASPVAVARALASRQPPAEPPVSVTPGVPPHIAGPPPHAPGPPAFQPPQPGSETFNTAQEMAAAGDPEAQRFIQGQSDINPFGAVSTAQPQYGTNVPIVANALKRRQLEGLYL